MINIKENEELNVLNHSCAHMMAQAIKRLYPEALFWVGPVINEGFYYDIDLGDVVLREEDFPKIEAEMKKIAKDGKRIIREELSKQQALELFANDPYKLDLINQMDDENTVITTYRQGEFVDLCRGPHVETVKQLKFFKLLKVSGAYWKGDANNKMLQRVYGICFANQEDLDQHMYMIEEAKKRDHKKLGRELNLFMMSEFGPGFPFWLPNGLILRRTLENYWFEEHVKEGYQFIQTPIMLSQQLWEVSGHWFNYRDNMYTSEIDDHMFAVKPMNCPGGMLVYKNSMHSYKDLPIRMGELGLVHRHEASGALNGLFRVRNFTQDDAHLYMTEEQVEGEVVRLIKFIDRIYSKFGLTYKIELSTRPLQKFIGEIEVWDRSEAALEKACRAAGKEFKLNPGDGAFYGPKLDFHIQDSLGRVWQCGTIQLDMNMPVRFDLTYIDSNGEKKRPVMLHRTIFGSVERFIGILIEHFAGAFPLWLAPVQVKILPVNPDYHLEACEALKARMMDEGIRVELDERNEKLGYRLREAQINKIPVQLVIGDGENANGEVNVRRYGKNESNTMKVEDFFNALHKEIREKTL
ncbi:MAG: threonine--tRNA ligase [Erysipelotrichaceae bacterium]